MTDEEFDPPNPQPPDLAEVTLAHRRAKNTRPVPHTGGVSLDHDELRVPLTLDAAAATACVSRRTVERWITDNRLPAYTGPDGRTYVIESDLLAVEHERRHSRTQQRARVNAA